MTYSQQTIRQASQEQAVLLCSNSQLRKAGFLADSKEEERQLLGQGLTEGLTPGEGGVL